MMLIPLAEIDEGLRGEVGGKAWSLATMAQQGLTVPDAVVVPAALYRHYVKDADLAERISLELSRKRFEEMRWEEMWDAALRIRNIFASTPLPADMQDGLLRSIEQRFGGDATVVRSSALAEDAADTSFAGLHESYVNVRGPDRIAEHIRLVWASLWSDAALLYRRELGLNPANSAMAVVVQRIVVGERSGVAFSIWPEEPSQGMIEAVWGLNQGLVDGTVEPDRWVVDRDSGEIVAYTAAEREEAVVPGASGVELRSMDSRRRNSAPLTDDEVSKIHAMSRRAEDLFGAPQDTEWTFSGEVLHILQSRPITTGRSEDDDGSAYSRSWYLSLRRSFDSLQRLRDRIEAEHIPAMIADAKRLAETNLAALEDEQLADEIQRRARLFAAWRDVYWEDFIPFAHGARLFGQVYNDTVRPQDPYEFIDLLSSQPILSMQRNHMLEKMAQLVRKLNLTAQLEAGQEPPEELRQMLSEYAGRFSDPSPGGGDNRQILELVLRMAQQGQRERSARNTDDLREQFLRSFKSGDRSQAEALLELGKVSYRLRDDDNIYLGDVEAEVRRAVDMARQRSERDLPQDLSPEDAARILREPDYTIEAAVSDAQHSEAARTDLLRGQERQLVGQPAGAGLARGRARVIADPGDLYDFEAGEILVVDSLDPTMTFVVPLAEAIVERRGGMLIHGAIIAREYGLPCVTGVPAAAELIRSGDEITVDGFLGIVTISKHRR